MFQEGNWIWIKTGDLVDFTAWRQGEPNNLQNNENCLHLYYASNSSSLFKWNDFDCNESKIKLLKPICKKHLYP